MPPSATPGYLGKLHVKRGEPPCPFWRREEKEAGVFGKAGKQMGAKGLSPPTQGHGWPRSHLLQAGHLTIIDLSCPCVTAEAACSLFNVCLSLFLEQESTIGRVIALDEAHKYMTDTAECETLTQALLTTIRLQRHQGARVIISTQEPTISPKLLDLCSVTIVHRFTSPHWLRALKSHLAGATVLNKSHCVANADLGYSVDGSPICQDVGMELFAQILALRTGEALLFAPSAAVDVLTGTANDAMTKTPSSVPNSEDFLAPTVITGNGDADSVTDLLRLEHGFMKIYVRKRITQDGGGSVMAG